MAQILGDLCLCEGTQTNHILVPGSAMLADPLTKRLRNSTLLRAAMQSAKYALVKIPKCDVTP